MHYIAKKTLDKIIETKNHYLVQVKENQPKFLKEIQEVEQKIAKDIDRVEEKEGCITTTWTIAKHHFKSNLEKWNSVKTLLIVHKTIIENNETISTIRYYVSDRKCGAKQFNKRIRAHWGIENLAHRAKDMNFKQDKNKAKNHNSAIVRGVFNTIAINHLNMIYNKKKENKMTEYQMTYHKDFKDFIKT